MTDGQGHRPESETRMRFTSKARCRGALLLALCLTAVIVAVGVASPNVLAASARGVETYAPASIQGTVTVSGGGPAAFATVVLYNAVSGGWVQSTSTDSLGAYSFLGLSAGTYKVQIPGGGGYALKYYLSGASWASATAIDLAAGETKTVVDAQLDAAAHVVGTVTGLAGAFVEGCGVSASLLDASGNQVGWFTATTGAAGTYDIGGLPAGTYVVQFLTGSVYAAQYYQGAASWGGATRITLAVGEAKTGIDAKLEVAAHLKGTVTAAGGALLPGRSVTAYRRNASGYYDWGGFATTDADGLFDIGGLRAGTYKVYFYREGDYLEQYYSGAATLAAATAIDLAAGETRSGIDAQLVAMSHITGAVTSAAGPLGGRLVSAYRRLADGRYRFDFRARTAANGTYDIGGLSGGTYKVLFDGDASLLTQWYHDQPDLASADAIDVAPGATVGNIDAVLHAAGHVTGTVKNAAAEGTGTVWVTAYRDTGARWDYVSDTSSDATSGTYDIGGLATGTYRIEFTPNYRGDFLPQWFENATDAAEATDVPVTAGETTPGINATLVRAGHIKGTVKNIAAEGLGTVWIAAYRESGGRWDYVRDATADATSGAYDIGGLATGTYRVRFAPSYGNDFLTQWFESAPDRASATDVPVTAGETTPDIDATMIRSGHVGGTVTATGGRALGGIWVTAYRATKTGRWAYVNDCTSDATSGAYDIGGLGTGTYRLGFYDSGGAFATEYYNDKATLASATDVSVTAGGTTSGKDAELAAAGHIGGVVTGEGDALLGGITVAAYREGDSGWDYVCDTTTSASTGGYDLGRLPAGDYRLRFSDRNGTYASECYDDKPSIPLADDVAVTEGAAHGGIDAKLALAGAISGAVKDAAGKPLGGIWVTAYRDDGSGWDYVADTSSNATSGGYQIGDLGAGSYRIEFDDRSGPLLTEWWDYAFSSGAATPVAVIGGATTPGIDATMTAGWKLTPSASGGGTITPDAEELVMPGADQTFTITPLKGHHIADVLVDKKSVGAVSNYYFKKVDADHTIAALFEADPALTLASPNGGTLLQNASQPVSFTLSSAVSSGSFRIWLRSTVTNAWVRVTPTASPIAAEAGKMSYTIPWTVTQPVGTYKLWVYYYAPDGTTVLGSVQSSGSITISVAPTPTLVSPNSGTFAQDAAQTVTWTMPGTGVSTGTFRVWLKNTVTNAWVRITPSASPVAAVAGKTSYSVPWSVTQAAGIYKLWVYYYAADGTTVLGTAQSTSTITITVKPRLTSPQSGSFAQGSSQTVAFSLYNAVSTGSFRLWLKNTSTNAWVRITPSATPIAAEAGKTTYSIPWPVNQAAGAYKLWVYYYSDAGGSTVVGTDVSTGTITITADPKPTLTSPQSGSFARNGPAQTITWTMSNGGSATGSFGLWLKNTVTNAWVRITPAAGTIPAEAGKTSYTYAWSVTQPAATYRLWVYYYATNGTTLLGSSVSSGAITLTGP